MPEEGGVDWSATLRAVNDDPTKLAGIVETALEELPRLLKSIAAAVTGQDSTAVRLAAHTLKGSLRCFGAAPAAEQAQRLEQMAHDGNLHDAAEVLRVLDAQTQEVVRCLAASLPSIDTGEATHVLDSTTR